MTSPSKQAGPLKQIIDSITGGVKPKMWLYKFIPLVLLQALAVFGYTALKNTKSSLFVRETGSNLALVYVKIIAITPMALLFPAFLKRITTWLGAERKQKVPYVLIGIFVGFYLIFAFVLLPMRNSLHFSGLLAKFLSSIPYLNYILSPQIIDGVATTIGMWTYSIFYAMSELWAVVGISYTAWGIANEICSKAESTVFYPVFGILSNIGGWLAATMMGRSNLSKLSSGTFESTLIKLVLSIVTSMAIMAVTYLFIERFVMKNPEYYTKREPKSKTKPSGDSLSIVVKHPYLRKIAFMFLGYSLPMILIEQFWYETITQGFGAGAFTSVHAKTTQINSISTILMSVLSTLVLSRFPWVVRAMLPVIMVGFSGLLFLGSVAFGKSSGLISTAATIALGMAAPMQLMVIFGAIQNIAGRCTKYSIFDATKEQLFHASQDDEVRTNGKAVVDVTVQRLSKSLGSVILVGLMALNPIITRVFRTEESSPAQEVAMAENAVQSKSIARDDANDIGKNGLKAIIAKAAEVEMRDDSVQITLDIKKLSGNALSDLGFEKKEENGKLIFTYKSTDKVESADIKVKPTTTKKKTPYADAAPITFFIVALVTALWAYSVIAIAPEYEANLRESEGGSAVKVGSESLSVRNLIYLGILSTLICGGLYYWVLSEINPILLLMKKA